MDKNRTIGKMKKPMNNTNHNNVTDTPESHIVFKNKDHI